MKKYLLLLFFAVLSLTAVQAQAIRKVLIEEHTGAWCGYCPDGALILEDIVQNEPNAIAVSVHNSDGMQNGTGSLIQNFYSPAFPQATFNRSGAPISRGSWQSATTTALQQTPVVLVSIDSAGYNMSTRLLKVKVKASFLTEYTGSMRMNMLITEDSVTGTGSGFDQVNYYNTTQGSPLYGLGNPILGYVHNHVFRGSGAFAWGAAGIIPSTVSSGEDFYHTFQITLASTWNINNMHIIGTVNMYGPGIGDRSILNSEEVPFSFTTALSPALESGELDLVVSPNPIVGKSTIGFTVNEVGNVKLEVYGMNGQRIRVLADEVTNSGMHTVYWDGTDTAGQVLANGIYLLRLQTEAGASITRRVMINR